MSNESSEYLRRLMMDLPSLAKPDETKLTVLPSKVRKLIRDAYDAGRAEGRSEGFEAGKEMKDKFKNLFPFS